MTEQTSEVQVFPDAPAVAAAARAYILDVLPAAGEDKTAHVVLAGGSTPALLYRLLAEDEHIAWDTVHFWFGDERTVPPDHDDSNFKMAQETLLSEVDVPAANVHRMRGEDPPGDAARAYADDTRRHVPANADGWPVFDVVILGLGEDGHTASLFPDTAALTEENATVVSNDVPQQDTVRITLTHPVLNAAKRVMFLATGLAKAEALAAVLEGGENAPPAALVRPNPGELRWFVDEAAASKLSADQVSR